MPVTINGDGSITGLSVGGLGSGVVNDTTLASNAVTNAKIANSAVTYAKTSGVSGLVPLATVNVTSNTSAVNFTESNVTNAFTDFKTYMIMMDGVRCASDNEDFEMRCRTGTNGATLDSNSRYHSITDGTPSADAEFGAMNRFRLNYNNVGNETEDVSGNTYYKEEWQCMIYIHGFEAYKRVRFHGHQTYMSSDGVDRGQYICGFHNSYDRVTGLELQFTNQNNITQGRFSIFGVA
tara:strand:+ start:66 stop:773 length:708 start_codon:yes stop_codon:yes gene_type:complete